MSRTVSVQVCLASLIACDYLHYAKAACGPTAFQCLTGRCIGRSQFCDGIYDCEDLSDEDYCHIDSSKFCPPGWIRCPSGNRCILSHWVCDGVIDCDYISEERSCDFLTCNPSLFMCTNGPCIPRLWFCDGKRDCGDSSDERYCDISPRDFCPPGWIRCPSSNKCILSQWECDEVTDCTGIPEDTNCGNNTSTTQNNTDGEKSFKSAAFTQVTNAAKTEVKSWILRRRRPISGAIRWGSQVHRIAVALHLADDSTFSQGSLTGDEIRYELTIQLLQRLAKHKKMSSQELALYIHALLVACMDPRDFYGNDLVRELRRRVETSSENYTNPFVTLALCNAGDNMTARDVEMVTAAYDSHHRPFWTNFQALASMALSCISCSHSGVSVDERTLKDMLQDLKRRQFRNGTVDDFRTTALVTQALFIHDSYKRDFNLDSAMKTLIDGQKKSKSLLDHYFVLPVLNGKSLLNISSSHCKREPTAEEETLQKILDIEGETMTVQYSVWMGDEINLSRTWRLKMKENSTIYDAIETVAKIDSRQKVKYNVVDGKPYVTALNEKEDDPEMGMFWFVYLKSLNSDKDPKIVEESPVDVKLKPNQEIILWYKRGPWNVPNIMQKNVTSS